MDTHQLLWGIAWGLGGTTGVITVVKCKMFDFLPTVSVIRRLIHLNTRGKGFITYWERHVYFYFYSNIYHAFKLNIQVLNLYTHICRISFLFWGALMNNTNIENIDKWIVKVQKLSSVWWYPCQTKCCFKMACSYIYMLIKRNSLLQLQNNKYSITFTSTWLNRFRTASHWFKHESIPLQH